MLRAVSGLTAAQTVEQAGALTQAALPSGRWTGQRCFSTANAAVAANTLYAGPFIPVADITVDQLAIRVATGSAGSGKIGIYTALPTLLPDTLVAEIAEDLDTTSTATLVGTFTANPTLRAGVLHWLATCFSATPTIVCWNHGVAQKGGFTWLVGSPVPTAWFSTGTATTRVTRNAALTYVPATQFFPATFGTATENNDTPGAPLVALRKA